MRIIHRESLLAITAMVCAALPGWGQSAATAGTVEGSVLDPSGLVVPQAAVSIENAVAGYRRSATTDGAGTFRFNNVPPNSYHLEVSAPGFALYRDHVAVRSAVPVNLSVKLALAHEATSVTVEGGSVDMAENVPFAHSDVDRSSLSKLPEQSAASGLSDAITLTAPGVAADSNGFFHPLGDHAQVTFSIDGQPVSDQQSKQFSTQIPANAIQSMEVISGAPPAEFGDKTSLVVNAITRSGLGQLKPAGSLDLAYGSFGTVSENAAFAMGRPRAGNFLAINTLRSGRFLDTPEFRPVHAVGNNQTVFDRFDYQPDAKDSIHINAFAARNWFQTPNTYDQPTQDQRQKVTTFNVAPGYQRVFGAQTLLTATAFVRGDNVNYYPSRDPFSDAPATLSQSRSLTNWGGRLDLSLVRGKHTLKAGVQLVQTRLHEQFALGITDPFFNPVCLDRDGAPQALPSVTDAAECAALGFQANPELQPGLVPFDLTRGGRLFQFRGAANINQAALYAQDQITAGKLTITAGLRADVYRGLSKATAAEPRIGVSYLVPQTGTVLRLAFSRTLETPYNENLVLSSATGRGGLAENVFGAYASTPIPAGRRNQFNAGIQQSIGRLFRVDADYFWKFTDNAFDFGSLLNTPVQFPISWRKSKIDGLAVRLSTTDLHGFRAIVAMGHARARFFGPSNGGLIFNSPLDTGVFRIDHDQAFQQTTHLRYQRPNNGPWIAFTWRYDSGLVAGAVPDLEAALALTAAQQAAIGFHCGAQRATLASPITSCTALQYGATRLVIPAAGTANADHNPPRVAPRRLFDVAVGTDNLFHTEPVHTKLRFSVLNLSNEAALYNFLSTFSGTHFVAPRTYQAEVGIVF